MTQNLEVERTLELLEAFRGRAEWIALLPMEAEMGVPIPIYLPEQIHWQIPFFLSRGTGGRLWLGIAVMDGHSGETLLYYRIDQEDASAPAGAEEPPLTGNLAEHIQCMLAGRGRYSGGAALRSYLMDLVQASPAYVRLMPICRQIQELYRGERTCGLI